MLKQLCFVSSLLLWSASGTNTLKWPSCKKTHYPLPPLWQAIHRGLAFWLSALSNTSIPAGFFFPQRQHYIVSKPALSANRIIHIFLSRRWKSELVHIQPQFIATGKEVDVDARWGVALPLKDLCECNPAVCASCLELSRGMVTKLKWQIWLVSEDSLMRVCECSSVSVQSFLIGHHYTHTHVVL